MIDNWAHKDILYPMGKLARVDRPKKILVSIPESVVSEVKIILHDPVTNRVKYGKMSEVITGLLRDWVEEQRKIPKSSEPVSKTVAEHFTNE